jgi:BNR repeat-like domain
VFCHAIALAADWITWDRTTDRVVSHTDKAAAYPRARRLSNGDILLGYHHGGGAGEYGTWVTLRRSRDGGKTWTDTRDIDGPEEPQFWGFSNVDFVELGDGGDMLFVTAARGKAEPGKASVFLSECERSELRLRFSHDYGVTWGSPISVARGRGRVWEPSLVRLPNGELEVYYACEAPDLRKAGRQNQRIEVMCSLDHGRTWTEPAEVSQHPGMRNGMPAAIVLANGKVACAQEMVGDKVSPWISFTHRGKRVEETVAQRAHGFGAAPALLRTPDDSVLLAFHSGFQKSPAPAGALVPWMFTSVWVQRGNAEAKDFDSGTQPWPDLDERTGMFFPSLFMKDADTIVALASCIAQPGDGSSTRTNVHWIEGKLSIRR